MLAARRARQGPSSWTTSSRLRDSLAGRAGDIAHHKLRGAATSAASSTRRPRMPALRQMVIFSDSNLVEVIFHAPHYMLVRARRRPCATAAEHDADFAQQGQAVAAAGPGVVERARGASPRSVGFAAHHTARSRSSSTCAAASTGLARGGEMEGDSDAVIRPRDVLGAADCRPSCSRAQLCMARRAARDAAARTARLAEARRSSPGSAACCPSFLALPALHRRAEGRRRRGRGRGVQV